MLVQNNYFSHLYECLNILYETGYQTLCHYTLGLPRDKRNETLETLYRVHCLSIHTGSVKMFLIDLQADVSMFCCQTFHCLAQF